MTASAALQVSHVTNLGVSARIPDKQLIDLIALQRDRRALAELYNRYYSPVCGLLQRGGWHTKLIGEIYNDVMLTVWNKAATFRGESKVSTWIFGIAVRIRMAHNRKENRHQVSDDREVEVVGDQLQSETLEQATRQADNEATLHAALTSLSDAHRTVIELAYFYGHDTQEIADMIDCPQNTVKTRLFYARKQLKNTILALSGDMNGSRTTA